MVSEVVMAAAHHEPNTALHAVIGGTAFIILLALLAGLIAFGAGREHS